MQARAAGRGRVATVCGPGGARLRSMQNWPGLLQWPSLSCPHEGGEDALRGFSSVLAPGAPKYSPCYPAARVPKGQFLLATCPKLDLH